MSGDDLNSSIIQSALRKREYKQLLEIGGRTAENCDTNSVVENLSALKQLLVKSNELIGQGDLADRVGQSAEVVLDAQVSGRFHTHEEIYFYKYAPILKTQFDFRCANWLVI